MAQLLKVPITKSDDLSVNPRTHIVQAEDHLRKERIDFCKLSPALHVHTIYLSTNIHTM